MKRLIPFVVVVTLISMLALPVYADSDDNWTQVLNFSTVNNSGSNYFVVNKSATISLELPMRTYGVWIDMLISTSDMDINSCYSIWNSTYTALTVKKVDTGLFRVYGRMSYHTYTELKLEFNCAGTGYYELLSCRICSLTADGTTAQADITLNSSDPNQPALSFGLAEVVTIRGADDYYLVPDSYEAIVFVKDATKYDSLTVYGSVEYASINSIRATYGGLSLDYSVNFIDVEAEEHFYGTEYDVSQFGKYIYAINIDLSQINRSQENYVIVYINGDYNRVVGMKFNCQTATGYVDIADTADATWWNRFTSFMTNLFSPSDPDAEDFGSTMESQAGALEDAVDELDQVTKPDIEDLDISLDEYLAGDGMAPVTGVFDAIFSNEIVVSMLVIALTCAFASYALFGKR